MLIKIHHTCWATKDKITDYGIWFSGPRSFTARGEGKDILFVLEKHKDMPCKDTDMYKVLNMDGKIGYILSTTEIIEL